MPTTSKPRACSFVSTGGRTCAHPALPRRPYCHLHATIQEAAGRVAGGFVSEVLSWFGGHVPGGVGAAVPPGNNKRKYQRYNPSTERFRPIDEGDDPLDGEAFSAEFDRMLDELRKHLENVNARARQAAPPPAAPRLVLNYYHALGVPPTALQSEIKANFKRIAFECHPDRNPVGTPDREAKLTRYKRAVEAYSVLSDPKKRAEFDAMLRYAAGARP